MDDCNRTPGARTSRYVAVQIPLWTIVTLNGAVAVQLKKVQIPLWTIVTPVAPTTKNIETGSDSSMDDCNGNDLALQV